VTDTLPPNDDSPGGTRVTFTLDAPGERLDRALAAERPELSRVQWQRLIRDGLLLVDDQPVRASFRLNGGEQIAATIPALVESDVLAEAIPLDVRYEDADIIVLNKPAGMVVHPSLGHDSGTLVNALLAHCPDLAGVGGERRPGIVHRLDKDTSGLIIAAKHDAALWHLQRQFKQRTVSKRYIALVHGHIQPPEALIDAPIGRDPKHRKRMGVIPDGSRSGRGQPFTRPAQTRYKATAYYTGPYTLLDCRPHTGRKHQIRVHLAYIDYPIVGDTVYGRRKDRAGLARHFLHAAELTFERPSDNTEITITAELPPDLAAFLDALTPLGS
jgi:23S rRNA pseudouridine1911/1915/1917 synthase